MNVILHAFQAPGARRSVYAVAPTHLPSDPSTTTTTPNSAAFPAAPTPILTKARLLDRILDRTVSLSGSQPVFYFIILALLAWAFLGIQYGQSNDWQVGISDAQAIINMVFDAFLMRQQLNFHDELMVITACLRSRTASTRRMLGRLLAGDCGGAANGEGLRSPGTEFHAGDLSPAVSPLSPHQDFAPSLPPETWLGRLSTAISFFLGHIITVSFFWVGIFIWIGFGAYCAWSNTWQLYINSATSAVMVFILAFLANIRERHSAYTATCLSSIWAIDAALEVRLRLLTKDAVENPTVEVPAPDRSCIQRAIDYYADLVGTLLGIAILILVMLLWVALGPVMQFSGNWWLLIGTYAGLVGMNDGFVLRNECAVLGRYADAAFEVLAYEDAELLALIGIVEMEEERVVDSSSLTGRVSVAVGNFCSHELTVVAGVVVIVGLMSGASAMGWSVMGQLLCNVPPSIIESFFMMILITGHNIGDSKRRVDLHIIYMRRLKLVGYVDALMATEKV